MARRHRCPGGGTQHTTWRKSVTYRCPVSGCPQGRDDSGMRDSWNVRWHFSYRHRGHRVTVAGERYRKRRLCGMQVFTAGTPAHESLATCRSRAALDRTFMSYREVLKLVQKFKYLGSIVSYDNNDTPAIRRNIKKAWRQWGQFMKEGAGEGVGAAPCGGHVLPSGSSFRPAEWQQELGGVAVGPAGT